MRRMLSRSARDFIDDAALDALLGGPAPTDAEVEALLARSLALQPLTVEETAQLLRATKPDQVDALLAAARTLKERVYGNRIVLFAPLYVGSRCVNDCTYCGFRSSNGEAVRETLSDDALEAEVAALERVGHKRLILVFGEHPRYDAEYIAACVERVYAVHARGRAGESPASGPEPCGEIRRLNVNAAPMSTEGFARVRQAGIGTFQVFQETYHHATFAAVHDPRTPKGDWLWRLDSPGRAIDAGLDDVGIGALFGLHDWRFEVLGLVSHARFLQEHHGVGPHTVSVPRLRPAAGVALDPRWQVSDADFRRLVAILRLAIPYTGLILTAREPASVRREVLALGVSQIDGGSRIDLGGYAGASAGDRRRQFHLGDDRSLDEVLGDLLRDGYLPSFCTACYRMGRTGEHFMEFAVPGFIKRFCTPNALCTLAEYLEDYASAPTRAVGEHRVAEELAAVPEGPLRDRLEKTLEQIRETGLRDARF